MTREEVIAALSALKHGEAGPYIHEEAEDLVMRFLKDQGYEDVVMAWYETKKRLDFWYD